MSQVMTNAVEEREEMTEQNSPSCNFETGQGNPEKGKDEVSGMQIPPDIMAFIQSQGISPQQAMAFIQAQGISPQQAIAFIRGQGGTSSGQVNGFIKSFIKDHHAEGCDCGAEKPSSSSRGPAGVVFNNKTCDCGGEGCESVNPKMPPNGGGIPGFQQAPPYHTSGMTYGNDAFFSQAFHGPMPGSHAGYAPGPVPGSHPGYAPGPVPGSHAGYAPGPVPGSHAGYARGPVPGNHPGYASGPVPGSHAGYAPGPVPGSHAGYAPGPMPHICEGGPRHFKHDQHQYGQMMEIVNDFANGTPNVGRVMDFLEMSDSRFWKGAIAGIALTLLLTNDTVKKAIFGTMGNLMEPFRKERSDATESPAQTS